MIRCESHASGPSLESRSDERVVILDPEAEHDWVMHTPGRPWLRCSTRDWRAADDWLKSALGLLETRHVCADWVGERLGLDRAAILSVSAPLQAMFAARLIESAEAEFVRTAHLCTELLGWTTRVVAERFDRWAAYAALLPAPALPLWILDAAEDLALALRVGDQLALAGLPVGLRVSRENWEQFIAIDAWDRCSTRWRLAPVLSSRVSCGEHHPVSAGGVEQLVRTTVPHALPLLEKARADFAAGPGEPDVAERARSVAEGLLFAMLDARPATRGRFRLNASLDFTFGTRTAEGDLTAPDARLVVEIDGYHHFRNTEDYRRDRRKDALLQEHGWFVLRFLAEDVVERLEETLRQIEATLARRTTKLHRAPFSLTHE